MATRREQADKLTERYRFDLCHARALSECENNFQNYYDDMASFSSCTWFFGYLGKWCALSRNFGAIVTINWFVRSVHFSDQSGYRSPRDFLSGPPGEYKRRGCARLGKSLESRRSVAWTKRRLMETSTFPSSAQEGHPQTESTGSTSAAGAEGYVTVWVLFA